MTVDAAAAALRMHAVPTSRRMFLPSSFTRDDCGQLAADILRLSSESLDDILLWLPPIGDLRGANALGDVLLMDDVAPMLGVLWGATWNATPVLLQACTLRLVTPHATVRPRRLEIPHRVCFKALKGPEEQVRNSWLALKEVVDLLERLGRTKMDRVCQRTGMNVDTWAEILSTKPEWTANEAIAQGWVDAVAAPAPIDQSSPISGSCPQSAVLDAVGSGRSLVLPASLTDNDALRLVSKMFALGQESLAPVLVIITGDTDSYAAAMCLLDHISLAPYPVIGLATGTLGTLTTVILQGCTLRATRPEAQFDLKMMGNWLNAEVEVAEGMSFEEAERLLLLDADRARTRLEAVGDCLAARTTLSGADWAKGVASQMCIPLEEARELHLIDCVLD